MIHDLNELNQSAGWDTRIITSVFVELSVVCCSLSVVCCLLC
jgi:hypothetical protein